MVIITGKYTSFQVRATVKAIVSAPHWASSLPSDKRPRFKSGVEAVTMRAYNWHIPGRHTETLRVTHTHTRKWASVLTSAACISPFFNRIYKVLQRKASINSPFLCIRVSFASFQDQGTLAFIMSNNWIYKAVEFQGS